MLITPPRSLYIRKFHPDSMMGIGAAGFQSKPSGGFSGQTSGHVLLKTSLRYRYSDHFQGAMVQGARWSIFCLQKKNWVREEDHPMTLY